MRTLKEGMSGGDVEEIEQFFDLKTIDGVFDTHLKGVVQDWQRAMGLVPDGIVGPKTRAKMGEENPIDLTRLEDVEFIQAKNYRVHTGNRKVDLIVLHTIEGPEKGSTAEMTSYWFGGRYTKAPMASAHLCIDNDSTVQNVSFNDIAFAAPGANHNGIQIEHAGYARQTRDEWHDEYSEAMLWRSAQAAAQICQAESIPIEFVDREGLKRGERGITTHREVTFAFRRSDHVDPGKNFPMDYYLDLVRRAYDLFS